MGKCRECEYCYTNETMESLYLCVNFNSDKFNTITGLCSEYDCPDCVPEMESEEE